MNCSHYCNYINRIYSFKNVCRPLEIEYNAVAFLLTYPSRALNSPLTCSYMVSDYRWAFLFPFIYLGFIRIPVILMIHLYNKQRGS